MRRIALLVALTGLLAAGAWLLNRNAQEAAPQLAAPRAEDDAAPVLDGARLQADGAATRAAQRHSVEAPAAGTTVVEVSVLDAPTRTPLPEASVHAIESGALIATADEHGMVRVAESALAQVAFDAPGHLLTTLALGKVGAERPGRTEVLLERDVFTIPFHIAFVGSDGKPPERVRFHILCRDEPPPSGGTLPRVRIAAQERIAVRVAQAWQEHVLVGSLPAFAPWHYHFGVDSHLQVYESAADVVMRFVAAGTYEIEARSSADEVASRPFTVAAAQQEALVVELRAGHYVAGVVVSAADGAPIAGAQVAMPEGGVAVAPAQSAADGAFWIGPATEAVVHVTVSHPLFEQQNLGPVTVAQPLRVALVPLPAWDVRGMVRRRADLGPIASARVALRRAGEVEARATTAADGRFALRTASADVELVIQAEGYVRWVEVLRRDAVPATFDLWPANPEERMRAGLSALLSGQVRGPDGKPRVGVPVQVLAEQAPTFQGVPGRQILEGGWLRLPQAQLTDAAGNFTLECDSAGPVRLLAVDGIATVAQGLLVQIVLGTSSKNLNLTTSR